MKTVIRGGAVIATLAILGGCATGPAYVRPTVEVPTAYKGHAATTARATAVKPPPGWTAARPSEAQRGAWWQVYDDPQLNALEQRVSVSNQTVRKAVATLEQARAVAGQARALYYPTVSAGGGVIGDHT